MTVLFYVALYLIIIVGIAWCIHVAMCHPPSPDHSVPKPESPIRIVTMVNAEEKLCQARAYRATRRSGHLQNNQLREALRAKMEKHPFDSIIR